MTVRTKYVNHCALYASSSHELGFAKTVDPDAADVYAIRFDDNLRAIDLPRVHPPESPDEEFQRHERLMLYHAEQVERLRPGAEPRRDEAVRLSADDIARLKYARDCVMTVYALHAHRLDYDPTLANPTIDTLDRLIASKPDTGAIVARKTESRLNAEDVARLRGAVTAWENEGIPTPNWSTERELARAIHAVLAKLEGR